MDTLHFSTHDFNSPPERLTQQQRVSVSFTCNPPYFVTSGPGRETGTLVAKADGALPPPQITATVSTCGDAPSTVVRGRRESIATTLYVCKHRRGYMYRLAQISTAYM